jgi:DNA modification methylase
VQLIQGDASAVLRTLPADSVQCCVTSPPYFGLRDYGAKGQIGLEATPRAYVARLVNLFGQVRRVLKPDGVLWLNLGDSYAGGGNGSVGSSAKSTLTTGSKRGAWAPGHTVQTVSRPGGLPPGFKPKDLLGIPWRVAFALQKSGWYLRSAAPWVKRNAMPESVTDRPASAVEYWFMLTRSARYYFDAGAVRTPSARPDLIGKTRNMGSDTPERLAATAMQGHPGGRGDAGRKGVPYCNPAGRSRRNSDWWFESVLMNADADPLGWDVPTRPYRGAHFATFPPKLIEPQILCSSRPGDTILDPFNGAGTTGVVAVQHGREYVGIDINPAYLDMARTRIEAARQLIPPPAPAGSLVSPCLNWPTCYYWPNCSPRPVPCRACRRTAPRGRKGLRFACSLRIACGSGRASWPTSTAITRVACWWSSSARRWTTKRRPARAGMCNAFRTAAGRVANARLETRRNGCIRGARLSLFWWRTTRNKHKWP